MICEVMDRIMTQEEKQLLEKDLCARLPYGVKVLSNESRIICELLRGGKYDDGEIYFIVTKIGCALKADEFKPFLRPMSSMTNAERGRMHEDITDWLNTHHFDYRGLIGKGLAIEAPEGMYENVPTSI